MEEAANDSRGSFRDRQWTLSDDPMEKNVMNQMPRIVGEYVMSKKAQEIDREGREG